VSEPTQLARTIGAVGFFTLAFGAIVGSGWVLVLGDWLTRAAPGGVVVGLLAGAAVLMAVGACYAELAQRLPAAGGEILYVRESFGPFPAFVVGWFIALNAISVCAFEAIALAWFATTLFPGWFDGWSFGIAVCGTLLVGALHYLGSNVAVAFQNIVTLSFISVMVLLILAGLTFGEARNLVPLFEGMDGTFPLGGMLWVFATAAFFLNGFQVAVHAIEERRENVSARTAVRSMLLAIAAAAAFYCLLIISTGFAAPWHDITKAELPAAAAFGRLPFGHAVASLALAAATVSLLKTWTAVALMGSRIIYAQARMGFLPAVFARLHPQRQVPAVAIIFITICTLLGASFGKSFIGTIVDTSAICMTGSFVICICCLLRQRGRGSALIYFALCGSLVMAAVALLEPFFRSSGRIPVQWWIILGWAILGLAGWLLSARSRAARSAELPAQE
jgi:basic amino acid/polyamine antiporter, APA family